MIGVPPFYRTDLRPKSYIGSIASLSTSSGQRLNVILVILVRLLSYIMIDGTRGLPCRHMTQTSSNTVGHMYVHICVSAWGVPGGHCADNRNIS